MSFSNCNIDVGLLGYKRIGVKLGWNEVDWDDNELISSHTLLPKQGLGDITHTVGKWSMNLSLFCDTFMANYKSSNLICWHNLTCPTLNCVQWSRNGELNLCRAKYRCRELNAMLRTSWPHVVYLQHNVVYTSWASLCCFFLKKAALCCCKQNQM